MELPEKIWDNETHYLELVAAVIKNPDARISVVAGEIFVFSSNLEMAILAGMPSSYMDNSSYCEFAFEVLAMRGKQLFERFAGFSWGHQMLIEDTIIFADYLEEVPSIEFDVTVVAYHRHIIFCTQMDFPVDDLLVCNRMALIAKVFGMT